MGTQRLGLAASGVAKIGSGGRQKLLRCSSGLWPFKAWWAKSYFLTFKFLSLVFLGYYTSNIDIEFMEDIQNVCRVITTNLWQLDGYDWRTFCPSIA